MQGGQEPSKTAILAGEWPQPGPWGSSGVQRAPQIGSHLGEGPALEKGVS